MSLFSRWCKHMSRALYVTLLLNPLRHSVLFAAKVHWTICLSLTTSGEGLTFASLKFSYFLLKFLSLYFFKVTAFDVGYSFFKGVDQGESHTGIDAALHVKLLVLLIQSHILQYLHHRVHAHISEMDPIEL